MIVNATLFDYDISNLQYFRQQTRQQIPTLDKIVTCQKWNAISSKKCFG